MQQSLVNTTSELAQSATHEAPSAVAHRASGRGWLRHPPRPPHRPKPQCRRQDGLRSPGLPACQQPAYDGRRRNCCQGRTSGGAGIGGRRAQVAGSDGGHRGARAVLCCRAGGLAVVGGALEGVLPKTTVRNSAGPHLYCGPSSVQEITKPDFPDSLGKDAQGRYMYSLGRASFNMYGAVHTAACEALA